MRGFGESGLSRRRIAQLPGINRVVRRLVMHGGRARLLRILGRDHGRQVFVIDDHRFGAILGGGARLGDHHGHLIADMAHLAQRQRRMRPRLHRRAVLGMDQPAADQALDIVGRHIRARQHGDDAGQGQCGRGIDRTDARMGVRTAHERGVALAGFGEVVGVVAAPGDEAEIFLAADRLSDQRGTHENAMQDMRITYA